MIEKRWTCPKCNSRDEAGNFCGNCGEKRPEPAPEMSEEDRLAGELYDTADHAGSHPVLEPWADGVFEAVRKEWLAVARKVRDLLVPPAVERGRAEGRREAYEDAFRFCDSRMLYGCQSYDVWVAAREWAREQRDACGPAKADLTAKNWENAYDKKARECDALRAEVERLRGLLP